MRASIFYGIISVFALFLLSCNRNDENDDDGGKGRYHQDDKEGLRMFLQQWSAVYDKKNAELVGLTMDDVNAWNEKGNETWVEKIAGLTWNDEVPKRLIGVDFHAIYNFEWSVSLRVAGSLDASKWTRLTSLTLRNTEIISLDVSTNTELTRLYLDTNPISEINVSASTALDKLYCRHLQLNRLDISSNTALTALHCPGNEIYEIDVSKHPLLAHLHVGGNQISQLDISNNLQLEGLDCSFNDLRELDISANPKLSYLVCNHNHLSLVELFKILENWNYDTTTPIIGPQELRFGSVKVGKEVDFSSQHIFAGIETVFKVLKNDLPAPEDEYELVDGKLIFNSVGLYVVKMENDAIYTRFDYPCVFSVSFIVV